MRDGIESLSALHFYADLSNFLKDRHYNHLPAFIQIRHAAGTDPALKQEVQSSAFRLWFCYAS
jgi:hypothetical protein